MESMDGRSTLFFPSLVQPYYGQGHHRTDLISTNDFTYIIETLYSTPHCTANSGTKLRHKCHIIWLLNKTSLQHNADASQGSKSTIIIIFQSNYNNFLVQLYFSCYIIQLFNLVNKTGNIYIHQCRAHALPLYTH